MKWTTYEFASERSRKLCFMAYERTKECEDRNDPTMHGISQDLLREHIRLMCDGGSGAVPGREEDYRRAIRTINALEARKWEAQP